MSGALNWINEWHRRACPKPTVRQFEVQLGCHLEEVSEMLEAFELDRDEHLELLIELQEKLSEVAMLLKTGEAEVRYSRIDRDGLLDSLADQVVTAVGVGYRARMDVVGAIDAVDRSNWSKFDIQGQPIFDSNGKVLKGPYYQPPKLEGFY